MKNLKKLLKWGGIIIVAIIIIGAIASAGKSGKSGSSQSSDSTSQDSKTSSNQSSDVKTYGLNEPVQDDSLAFTVTGVEKAKTLGNQYTARTPQGIFYVVTLKIENKGNKTVTFDSSMAKVTDSQGREFERSIEGQTAKGLSQGKVDLFLQQVQPSLSATGDLVFDLPAEIQDPTLVVKGTLFSKGAKIKLQ